MVKDYQGIIQDFVFLADTADAFELRIDANQENIAINVVAIALNKSNFESHDQSNSEHGVTGKNVGTEDYCTVSIGGVVLLMGSVSDAISSTQEIALDDILDAPAIYDPIHMQKMVDMANDTKAKHNQLVLDFNAAIIQFNELIANSKTSKQMAQ